MHRRGVSVILISILLVTDDEEQAILFTLVLEKAGYQVIRAATGEDALVSLAHNRSDIVLTDYYLPGSTGQELIRSIQQHYPSVRTILMSNCYDVRDLAYACHADGWYPKTDLPLLLSTLSRLLPDMSQSPLPAGL